MRSAGRESWSADAWLVVVRKDVIISAERCDQCWVRAWLVVMRAIISVEESWMKMGVIRTKEGCGQWCPGLVE